MTKTTVARGRRSFGFGRIVAAAGQGDSKRLPSETMYHTAMHNDGAGGMTGFGRPKAMRSGSRFTHLLLLLVLAWQGVVVQTHTHFAPVSRAPTSATAAIPLVAAAGTTDASVSSTIPASACFLCEEQALFGAYVLTAPVALVAPVADVAWYDATAGPYSARSQSSHSWRSRAPPASVHLSTI